MHDPTASERADQGEQRRHFEKDQEPRKRPGLFATLCLFTLAILTAFSVIVGGGLLTFELLQPKACPPKSFGDWQTNCLYALATVDARATPDAQLGKVGLVYNGGTFKVYPAMSLDRYRKFYTNTSPTLFQVGKTEYVYDEILVWTGSPVTIEVAGLVFPMSTMGKGGWMLSEALSKEAIEAARGSYQIFLTFYNDINYVNGSGTGLTRTPIATLGLVQALETLP